ncbi:AbrB family transcriptional regulator [Aneurinibacillus sp. UBA3580]|jgi:membrane AbrB-like protein|uniref:AbrB family transcriptional regulator n=1 Tax=Aneurinibacillus sp. UBA3580 TaxID=1946041 RepID=UPI00257DFE44|nr:AbrB family transcriptional regulator [Aneurinibacillus sp. UBA3580]
MERNYTYFTVLEAAAVALVGALLFTVLRVPLPWILGPVAAVTVWRLATRRTLMWPYTFRETALLLLGYMLGASFTRETGLQIIQQLPFMLASTVLTVLVSLSLGVIIARRLGVDIASGVFGSVPGGLSQMLVLSEETERVDATMVAFMQTIRVLAVIFFVPFLTVHGLGRQVSSGGAGGAVPDTAWMPASWEQYLLYAGVVIAGAWGGKRIGLPAAALTGPMLGTAAVIMVGAGEAPHLPHTLVLLSQFAIGTHIGLQMKPQTLKSIRALGLYTVLGSVFLVLFSLLLAFLLTLWTPMTLTTAFLSTAPGGIAEMGVTASMVHADLSMVSGYQLFRVFFVMFIVPPLLQWWIRKGASESGKSEEELPL